MIGKRKKLIIIISAIILVALIAAIIIFIIIFNKENSKSNEKMSYNTNLIGFQNNTDINNSENMQDIEHVDIIEIGENNENINSEENINIEENIITERASLPYSIKVNVQTNTVIIYQADQNGEYNIPLKAMACSCGTSTPTEGEYNLKKYNNWAWKTINVGEYGQYATQIVGNVLFSSVPYTKKGDKNTLKYEEYDKLGTIASKESIRLTVEDAKWIYDNCQAGTQVTFYSSNDQGPLTRPETKKITEDEQVRGWDPTDPDTNNPWRNYVRPERTENENSEQNQTGVGNTLNLNQTNGGNTVNSAGNTNQNNAQSGSNSPNQSTQNQNNSQTNSIANSIEHNSINQNSINNDRTENNVQTQNRVVENKILEENEDVTIKSEIIDY